MQHASWLAVVPVPAVPELLLHQAEDLQGLWEATDAASPPYWAFPWLGGQALARYVLDHPSSVAGLRVLDLAAGSGLVGLAALRAGAASVLACDIDPLAAEAVAANAACNDLLVTFTGEDLLDGSVPDVDVVLAGDVVYEAGMAARVLAWLRSAGVPALLGDPGRSYLPQTGLREVASYDVPTTRELEGVTSKLVRVYEVLPVGSGG